MFVASYYVQAELAERLKVSESRVDTVRAELDCLREAQIKEIEERCSEVDSLKAQLQGEVADLQQEAMKNKEEVRQVKGQLAKCQTLNSQLTEERKTAQQRIEQISR